MPRPSIGADGQGVAPGTGAFDWRSPASDGRRCADEQSPPARRAVCGGNRDPSCRKRSRCSHVHHHSRKGRLVRRRTFLPGTGCEAAPFSGCGERVDAAVLDRRKEGEEAPVSGGASATAGNRTLFPLWMCSPMSAARGLPRLRPRVIRQRRRLPGRSRPDRPLTTPGALPLRPAQPAAAMMSVPSRSQAWFFVPVSFCAASALLRCETLRCNPRGQMLVWSGGALAIIVDWVGAASFDGGQSAPRA